mmetsp:Transcript_34234/g.53404  ORF Transcript_34234/g.53404 Transcript_34234/m.53404 type:complete len:81 (-) Transcript_34234:2940-3182(-)
MALRAQGFRVWGGVAGLLRSRGGGVLRIRGAEGLREKGSVVSEYRTLVEKGHLSLVPSQQLITLSPNQSSASGPLILFKI